MRLLVSRKRFPLSIKSLLVLIGIVTGIGFTLLTLKLVDPSTTEGVFYLKSQKFLDSNVISVSVNDTSFNSTSSYTVRRNGYGKSASCATVEEMGEGFGANAAASWKDSLRVRKLINQHFDLNGPSRVRQLLPDQFCRHGFVIAKASEAGFGNEMYKILNAAALSIMLNRSLIIGQTRHIGSFSSLSLTYIASFPVLLQFLACLCRLIQYFKH